MTKQELFIGIGKNNSLWSIEYDHENNKEHKTFSLSGTEYDYPVAEEEGEEQARERLKDPQYWEDLGYIEYLPSENILYQFIDFEKVAEFVINNDGWQNVNGEYEEFGKYEGEDWYFSLSGCGQHKFNPKDIKYWLIPQKDALKILALWKKYHLSKKYPIPAHKAMLEIVNKNSNATDRQKVLEKYKHYVGK